MVYVLLAVGLIVAAGLLAGRWLYEPGYHWGKQVLIALDQLANTILRGWPDETFSARCWRLRKQYCFWRIMRVLVDALARLCGDKDHCRLSYESELWGLQQAPETRAKRGGDV